MTGNRVDRFLFAAIAFRRSGVDQANGFLGEAVSHLQGAKPCGLVQVRPECGGFNRRQSCGERQTLFLPLLDAAIQYRNLVMAHAAQ